MAIEMNTFELHIDPPKADPQGLRPTQMLISGNFPPAAKSVSQKTSLTAPLQ